MLPVTTEPFISTESKIETENIKREIRIAVIDFNISHTYQASKVFLPKNKYDLILLNDGLYNPSFILKQIKVEQIIVEPHPLETIKEIIVI